MSSEEGGSSAVFECQIEQRLEHHKDLFNANNDSNGNCFQDNGEGDANPCYIDARDELLQTVMEHKFQNEYFKSQFESLKLFCQDPAGYYQQSEAIGEDDRTSEEVKSLHEKLESVGRELSEEKQTGIAAEEALKHLRALYSEADAKAQELSAKLAEAQQRMDQEIKDRDEKYSDLDSKFSRLHKRAKQRIQDIQKEKDELEARLQNLNEAAEQASLQQSAMQQELERTRHHANEALKAMDVERQQLRSANNKFRDNIEELGRSLEDKKNTLEALHQSLLEKEQVLEDMRESLKAADEKRQTSLAELSAKHQKQVVSLEAQLADALSDRNKATETISSLQVLLADKESQIAEIDAASTGEVARLMASMETIKRELIHFKQEHEKEKEGWEAASHSLKAKLEAADSNRIHAELEAAKMRSQLEYGESLQSRLINSKEAELIAAKEEINRLEREFLSYKARAHALLQKKDAEVAAAKESDQLKALEEEIKEAEKEIISISTERDVAFQELQVVLAKHSEQLAARDADLSSAKQQIIDIGLKLDSTKARHQSEKEAWEINLQNLEETWRIKFEALKAQAEASSDEDLKKEVKELKTQYKILKEEHESFHDLSDRMIEEKDNEITKLLDDNDSLRRSLDLRPQADHYDNYITGPQKLDASNSNTSVAEQQILLLARQQAQREEELAQSQRHILALQEEIEELERENRLHSQQEAMLKDELRSMERMQKREGIDMTYLKNVILKLLETGEVEALLPVIGMLLQFSPEELRKCQLAYRSAIDVLPSQTTDESGSALSLFSRFSFS